MGWFSKVGTFIKNNAHTILDVAGMIPGVGAVADLANAALYAAEGDWANAAMSAVSAVPGIGDTIAMANKGMKAAKGVKTALKAGKSLKSIVKAGGKSVLKAIKGKAKAGAKAVKNWKETLGSIFKKKKTGDKHICTNGKCFTGDTLVCTNKGKVPIQEIRAGDLVYSRNEDTGEMGFQKVKEVFRTETHTIHEIEVNGEMTIQTTAYHPFYVEEKGWVSAINLQKGDCLLSPEGLAEVTGTRRERFEEPMTMYNFHVEEWVSYFVSELNLYVHNGNGHEGIVDSNDFSKDFEDLANYRKQQGMPVAGSPEDKHTAGKLIIGDNEYYGRNGHGNQNEVKSVFSVNAQTATHAEGDVFYQAKIAGETNTSAILITDRRACRACGYNGGIRSMAKQMGITDLTIISPGYKPIKFNPQIKPVPNPFK